MRSSLIKTGTLMFTCMSILFVNGCGRYRSYTPVEPTAEQVELKSKPSSFRDDFKRAYSNSQDYVMIAVLDREYIFTDMPELGKLTRMLILHREQLDLDDYHFSLPGKEASEDGQLETVLGEFFWITKDGDMLFDDSDQPPDTEMVVEWFVQSGVPEASLHFGGNPCLTVRLTQ